MYPAIMRMVFVENPNGIRFIIIIIIYFFLPWMKASQRWIQQIFFESEL